MGRKPKPKAKTQNQLAELSEENRRLREIAATLRSSPTVFADTPMPRSASTCIASGNPPSATWSAAMLLGLYRIWSPSLFAFGA